MHSIFTILFCIGIVVGINCARLKQPASINKDSTEIAELLEKIWSKKPELLNRAEPLNYCAAIDKCCEDKDRMEAVSLMNDNEGRFRQVIQRCMNSSNSKKADHVCSSAAISPASAETLFNDMNVQIYMDIINNRFTGLNNFVDEILSTCNNEEIHAFICLSNKKLMQKCTVKVLQKNYDSDYKNYQTNIKGLKEIMISADERISEELN